MSELYKLTPEDTRHRNRHIFFDREGNLYYGKDEDDLTNPEHLELYDKFPITIKDLENAFRLGLKVGRGEE